MRRAGRRELMAAVGVRPVRMRWIDLLAEAAMSILGRPGRSMLTAVGTVLGAAAFVAVLGLSGTAGAQVSETFDVRRATEVLVRPDDPATIDPQWQTAEAAAALRRLGGVEEAGRRAQLPGQSIRRGVRTDSLAAELRVVGADPDALGVIEPELAVGRLPDMYHERVAAKVVLLPRAAAGRLAIAGVGVAVFIGDEAFTVIGIMNDVARRPETMASAVIPFSTAEAMSGPAVDRDLLVETAPGAAARIGAQAPLAARPHEPSALRADAAPDPGTLRRQVEGNLTRLILLLSVVTLAIGAVSIGNAATAAIAQRTPEIGLRRAVGARRGDVFVQLVAETTALGAVGGSVGSLLGVAVTVGVSLANGWVPVLDLRAAIVATVACAATGVLAGLAPAVRAARIQPIAAIQR